jgi:Mitochondrial inner membrane protein
MTEHDEPGGVHPPAAEQPPAASGSAPSGPAEAREGGSPRLWPRVVGVAVLAAGVGGAWLWQHPELLKGGAPRDDGAIARLEARITRLEQRPAAGDTSPLAARLDTLEKRVGQLSAAPPASTSPGFNPGPLIARLDALEARAPGEPGQGPDMRPLLSRLDALERTVSEREAAQRGIDTVANRLDDLEHLISGLSAKGASVAETADRAARLARVSGAELALAEGRPLGAIPDAPAALNRFATSAPPTEAALRLAFPAAERAAIGASVPDTEGKPFLGRVLARLQDVNLITIKEGDRVVVGNVTADVLHRARALLEAGDLAGAVRGVASLKGPPAATMAAWLDDANALLAAREALATLARNG